MDGMIVTEGMDLLVGNRGFVDARRVDEEVIWLGTPSSFPRTNHHQVLATL